MDSVKRMRARIVRRLAEIRGSKHPETHREEREELRSRLADSGRYWLKWRMRPW